MVVINLLIEVVLFLLLMVFLGWGILIHRDFLFNQRFYVYILLCFFSSLFLLCNNVVSYNFINGYYSLFFILILLSVGFFTVPYIIQYNHKFMFFLFEFSILFLFIIVSVIFMMQTYYLLLFFLFFEIHNVCLYILIPFSKNNGNFVESGLKYFILSSFSSIMMLLGISFLYYSFGTLDLLQIESVLFISDMVNVSFFRDFGFIFLLLGFLFKLYCVPFHFWVSDVYHGSPTSSTLILACISYISVFFVFFIFFVNLRLVWIVNLYNLLFFFILLCLFIGGIGGLFQKQIKRLIAYSSISSVGYILYGFVDRNEILYVDAFYYVFIYFISLIGIFLLLFFIEVHLYIPLRSSIDFSNIDNFSGFFYVNKYYTILFTFLFFSISGIPPFFGFFTKFLIFEHSLYNMNFIVFIFMFINSLCSCYFYFYFIKVLYYDKPFFDEIKLSTYYFSNIFFLIYLIVFFLIFGLTYISFSDNVFQFFFMNIYDSIFDFFELGFAPIIFFDPQKNINTDDKNKTIRGKMDGRPIIHVSRKLKDLDYYTRSFYYSKPGSYLSVSTSEVFIYHFGIEIVEIGGNTIKHGPGRIKVSGLSECLLKCYTYSGKDESNESIDEDIFILLSESKEIHIVSVPEVEGVISNSNFEYILYNSSVRIIFRNPYVIECGSVPECRISWNPRRKIRSERIRRFLLNRKALHLRIVRAYQGRKNRGKKRKMVIVRNDVNLMSEDCSKFPISFFIPFIGSGIQVVKEIGIYVFFL